jgi:hypothetical protein
LLKLRLTRKNINDLSLRRGNFFTGSENSASVCEQWLMFRVLQLYRSWQKAQRNGMAYLVLCIHVGETPCEFIHLDCHHNDVLLIKRNSWGALYYE